MIKTEIGQTTPERITVRGHDLANELIGQIDFVDMLMLVVVGRRCQGNEKEMINTILVTVTDHGLTPSALAARLTFTGAPEAPQAAVAAGLLGAGSVLLGAMQDAAVMLRAAAAGLTWDSPDGEIAGVAKRYVAERRAARQPLYGLGHNIHVNGDPRVPVLRAVSERNGYFGHHWRLLLAMDEASRAAYGRRLPANTAGAVGAMILSMGLPLHLARGLSLVGRCAGLVGHLVEEEQHPTGSELWSLVLRQDERNVLPEDRHAAR
ncbi:citryl-CoA lyase [Pseudofrankia sp. DC12]|uniref:citryl-CoA lyase n=1 Tax=Pseudofrankia sp. DC12 TaxID=683315 RepID=UPI0005F7F934|nr:citryl-CoA lyase [Pseudofrankia sp. DC12]